MTAWYIAMSIFVNQSSGDFQIEIALKNLVVFCSVRPILRIGEYSLVALQHRRIRYIGLRVSADAE